MITLGAHPPRVDLVVHPGDPIDFTVPILDGLGVAQALSGWVAAATVTQTDGQVLYEFTPGIVGDVIQVTATPDVTAAWEWPVFAARLTITATPPGGAPSIVALGWIRLYR